MSYYPEQMANAILDIPKGGVALISLTATQEGTYMPAAGEAYSSVTVSLTQIVEELSRI